VGAGCASRRGRQILAAPDGAGDGLGVYDTVGTPAFIEGQVAWYSKQLRRQEAQV
jgi:hypothetical protein